VKRIAAILFALSVSFVAAPKATAQRLSKDKEGDPGYKLRVEVVDRVTTAINYRNRSGSTMIGFRGTPLQPGARGEAKVESKRGYTEVRAAFDNMIPANRYGRQYLTYVLWAVTPEGRSTNLGELVLKGTKSNVDVTTGFQAFGLVVTAEPYYAVSQPSDRVVLENYVRPETLGKVEEIHTEYELVEKNTFALERMPKQLLPPVLDVALPLDLQEAENAVRIAKWAGAEGAAWDVMAQAEDLLEQAEGYYVHKAGDKPISTVAREAVQTAEDARLITMRSATVGALRRR
jgi:hypothetical protein